MYLDRTINDFGESDEINDNDREEQNKKNRSKKKRLKKSSQIAENLESITSKLKDDFQDVIKYFLLYTKKLILNFLLF